MSGTGCAASPLLGLEIGSTAVSLRAVQLRVDELCEAKQPSTVKVCALTSAKAKVFRATAHHSGHKVPKIDMKRATFFWSLPVLLLLDFEGRGCRPGLGAGEHHWAQYSVLQRWIAEAGCIQQAAACSTLQHGMHGHLITQLRSCAAYFEEAPGNRTNWRLCQPGHKTGTREARRR